MKKIQAALLLVIVAALLSACQPTPSAPVVVNKNDGQFEQALQKTDSPAESKPSSSPYQAPQHWSETVNDEKLTIKIDTDIKMPGVNAYPVIKVKPATLTQQQVDTFVNYFAAGKKLYKPHVKTKADYAAEIVEAKRGQEVDGKYVVTEDSKDWVKELEKEMANAPDDSPLIYTDTTLTYKTEYETGKEDTSGGKNFLDVRAENGNGKDDFIEARNYVKGFSGSTGFYYSSCVTDNYLSETNYKSMMKDSSEDEIGWVGYGDLYKKVTMTEEEAQAKAQKVIDDLGIKDMALENVSKAVSKDYPDKGGYQFEYMRNDGGLIGYRSTGGGGSRKEEPPQYSPPYTIETLDMLITEDGVLSFGWGGIANIIETVNSNVALLPFDKIQQALKNQIKYKKSFGADDMYGMNDYTVTVTSAELRAGYIGVKDNAIQALFVPVWVFQTEQSWYNTSLKKEQNANDNDYVLNAIDGGIIDINWQKLIEEHEQPSASP